MHAAWHGMMRRGDTSRHVAMASMGACAGYSGTGDTGVHHASPGALEREMTIFCTLFGSRQVEGRVLRHAKAMGPFKIIPRIDAERQSQTTCIPMRKQLKDSSHLCSCTARDVFISLHDCAWKIPSVVVVLYMFRARHFAREPTP